VPLFYHTPSLSRGMHGNYASAITFASSTKPTTKTNPAIFEQSSKNKCNQSKTNTRTVSSYKRRGNIAPTDLHILNDEKTFGKCVYSHADWSHAYKSTLKESEYVIKAEDVIGRIPNDVKGGVLYRVGPGKFERNHKQYKHMLDGDGLALRFEFELDGKVSFLSKFVRTKEFKEEDKENKVLYRGTFGTMREGGFLNNFGDIRTKNLANTNILHWNSRVFALYEAGRPVELDSLTLNTRDKNEEFDFDGLVPEGQVLSFGFPREMEQKIGLGGKAFTAHPHVDPTKNVLCAWCWRSFVYPQKAVEITFFEFPKNSFVPEKTIVARLEGCEAAPHDFGVTSKYYVMALNNLTIDPLPYILGIKGAGECLVSQPESPLRFYIIPRNTCNGGSSQPIVIEGPNKAFEIHTPFAHDGVPIDENFTLDDENANDEFLTLYSAGWDDFKEGTFLGEWGRSAAWDFPIASSLTPDFNNIDSTVLWRYVVNISKKTIERSPAPGCNNVCIDHPHVNPLYEGKRECRYVYASLSNFEGVSGPPLGYVKIDLKTGSRNVWFAGNRTFCEELVVVPKENGTNEDDVWLLGMFSSHQDDIPDGQSGLYILDGRDVEAGPIARVNLSERISHGLHGTYVSQQSR
jgi:all-trans-8'-apo-beta-carotenal 15,15'-oxygenase